MGLANHDVKLLYEKRTANDIFSATMSKNRFRFLFANIRAGQVRMLVRKSANPRLRTNEKSCGHADLRTLAV